MELPGSELDLAGLNLPLAAAGRRFEFLDDHRLKLTPRLSPSRAAALPTGLSLSSLSQSAFTKDDAAAGGAQWD